MKSELSRRCLAEFIGTFGIVFAPVALSATGSLPGGDGALMASAWVSGLSVLAMIYALGHISAAHFNPAVTLGFAISNHFPKREVVPYWIAQFSGGIVAAGLSALLFGAGYGVHVPAAGLLIRAVGVEAVLAFFLMLVIISVATDTRSHGAVPGLAIGMTVVFDVWIGGPVSGGSMNPARSLGPALFGGAVPMSVNWIYWVGPAFGAVVAARLYEILRGEQTAPNSPSNFQEAASF